MQWHFLQSKVIAGAGVQKDIVQIETFVTYSVLTFAPDVEIEIDELATGDVLVLNPNKLIINGRPVRTACSPSPSLPAPLCASGLSLALTLSGESNRSRLKILRTAFLFYIQSDLDQ